MKELENLLDNLIQIEIDKNDLNSTYHQIQSIYFEIFKNHLHEVKQYNLKSNTNIFRVRKNNQDILFQKPIELLAPPPHKTPWGRFNLHQHPLYYCSDNSSTAILESKPQEGDFISLVESLLLKDLVLSVSGYCKRYNTIEIVSEKLNMFYDRIMNLTNKIIEDDIEYILTATLGNVILSDQTFNGLMYPSIYSKEYGDNFALQIDVSNEYLLFKNVRQFQVIKKYNINHLILKCIEHSDRVSQEGNLVWIKVEGCNSHEIRFDEIPLITNESKGYQ